MTRGADLDGDLVIEVGAAAPDVTEQEERGTAGRRLTSRLDLQTRDGHSTRAKAFDSFCPIGPCIVTDIDPNGVDLETYVNGERRQACNTKHLVCSVEDLVARVAAVMTLLPGDVIATGTPGGAGPLHPGDKVEVRIENIGGLKNPVIKIQENLA